MPTDTEALQSLAQEKENDMCKELVENLPFELPFAFPSFPGNKYQQIASALPRQSRLYTTHIKYCNSLRNEP